MYIYAYMLQQRCSEFNSVKQLKMLILICTFRTNIFFWFDLCSCYSERVEDDSRLNNNDNTNDNINLLQREIILQQK